MVDVARETHRSRLSTRGQSSSFIETFQGAGSSIAFLPWRVLAFLRFPALKHGQY